MAAWARETNVSKCNLSVADVAVVAHGSRQYRLSAVRRVL